MSRAAITVLGTVILYLTLVLGVGEYARRRTTSDREDFMVASRSFGPVVMFFALVATMMTAVTMIGFPGDTYIQGVGMFGWFLGAFMLLAPLMMATFGLRIWMAGQKFGHVTPGELFNHRYDAKHLGSAVTLLMILWTVPYMTLGAIGAGVAFSEVTQGFIPYWLGSLVILATVFLYVLAGGMRGTGWTNTLQGAVFLLFLWGFMIFVGIRLGGFSSATANVVETRPELLTRAGSPQFGTKMWLSFALLLPLNILLQPHIFRRILTARSNRVFKMVVVLFPLGIWLGHVPAFLLGFWGAGVVPGLEAQAIDNIIPILVSNFGPPLLAGILLAGILAAIMSSIDGQTLALSTIISVDIVDNYKDVTGREEVLLTRIAVAVVLAFVYALALIRPGTVFGIAAFAFSGYALLCIPLLFGLYWPRVNRTAAWVGIVWGFVGLIAFEASLLPAWLSFGFMPYIPVAVSQLILVVGLAYLTSTTDENILKDYFSLYRKIW